MYVSYLASDFDIYRNKLNRYDLKRCQGFRLKICYLQKPEMTNEVLLSMLKSNSEEYETFINNDFWKIPIGKNITSNISLKVMIL